MFKSIARYLHDLSMTDDDDDDAGASEPRIAAAALLVEAATADGSFDALLYVSDRDRGEAKKRVLERLQIRTDNKTDG